MSYSFEQQRHHGKGRIKIMLAVIRSFNVILKVMQVRVKLADLSTNTLVIGLRKANMTYHSFLTGSFG